MLEDEEAALRAAANLDLADRISHKLWKARKSAYEFVSLQLSSTDGASQHKQFARFSPSMISDANPGAQDAACDAITKLLQVCESSVVTEVASTLSKNVVAKTFKGRPALVKKSTEILLQLVEHECAEDVMRHIVAAYKDKVAKVAQTALAMTLAALQQFGPKVFLPSLFASSLAPVFDGRDVASRKTAQDIVVELARWQGPDAARASILPKLRETQRKDIEAMFQDLPPGRPVPERRTRSAKASIGDEVFPEETPAETKPPPRALQRKFTDDVVEVDILAQIPKSMWTEVEDAKWSVRKNALTSLKTAASVPRAVPGDLHDIAGILKRIIQKDSNAACVAEACACVAALSTCMRTGFSNFARSTFLSLCLDKSKDKNSAVRARALEAVTAMHTCCVKLADVAEQVAAALGSPSPQVKQATLSWLAEAVEMEGPAELKPLHKQLLPICATLCTDAVPAVRDGAVAVIAAFARVAGKLSAIDSHISALDDRRRKQVEEAISGGTAGSGAASPPQASSRPATAGGGRPGTPPVNGARPPLAGASRPGTAATKRLATTKTNRPTTSASGAPPAAPTLQPTNVSKDDAKEFISEKFGAETLTGITNSVWKNRLEALATIQEARSSMDLKSDGAKVCLSLCHLPGWKDSNFQVLAKVCNICHEVVRDMSQFAKGDAHTIITGVVDKLSDLKIQPHACELLSTLAETTTLSFVMSALFKPASSHRNPKVYQASITWMTRSMAEFGKASVDSKAAVTFAVDMLSHKDAAVREAGTEFAAVLHEQMGARLDGMLAADVKSAMMDKVRARWASGPAVTGEKQRTEKSRQAAAAKASQSASSSASGSVSGRPAAPSMPGARVTGAAVPSTGGERTSDAMLDVEPRTDISPQITDTLLKQMSDNNWKERKEAVETVEGILQRAGGRIEPSFGGLLQALKLRIPDSNRNLAAQVIRLAASVCSAAGQRFASAGRTIVLPILKACSDSKPAVQTAVAQFATEYVMQCGWAPLGDAVSEAMGAKCTSGGKVVMLECFNALVSGSHPPQDDQEGIVILCAAAAGLLDKGLEPRRLAGELIGHVQAAGISSIPAGASSLISADKMAALSEKMGPADVAATSALHTRPGRLQTTASTRPAARSASASGRPGTAGAASGSGARGSSADPRPATSAGGRAGAVGRSALMTQASTSSLPASGADEGEVVIHLVDESEQDDRRVPQRSFKFEQRLGEAKEVHAYLSPAISASLASLMFSADFKKHCLACDKLVASLDTYVVEMASVLDLLLRWSVLRFVEEKLQSVVKVQAFLARLLEHLVQRSYQATDNEANVFLPCLCEKAGHNQERVRAGFAQLLALFRALYNPHRYVVFLLEGMESKNIKSRAECCDALAETLREWGIDVLYHGPRSKRTGTAIKRLAACTAERDSKLRKSALGALMVVLEQEGSKLWHLLGDDLPSTQADLIKERAKFVEMEMTKRGVAPGTTLPTKAPPPAAKAHAPFSNSAASSPVRENGAVHDPTRGLPVAPAQRLAAPFPHAEPAGQVPSFSGQAQQAHVIATGVAPGVYQEPSTNALHTVPFVPGHPSGSGGVDGTPPPGTARASYYSSYSAALQQLLHDQNGACVEAIKTIYWTLSSMGDGPQASAPVEEEAQALIRSSINDVVLQLMSRSLVLSNLATTLALAQGTNPLRPLRYLMNCMLKIWEIRLSDLLEVPPMTLVTREVLAQLTNHRQIHATFAADGSALLRLLNMIMLKILESSKLNSIFAALLNCLLQIPDIVTTRGPTQVHCYLALTVKCLTKITKTRLAEEPVDLPTLLLDLHRYFSTLGASEVRRLSNNNDKPLRMVKTMLHTLCKIHGYKVADTIASLPELRNLQQQPMVAMYADINLKSLAEIGMIAPRDGGDDAVAALPAPSNSDAAVPSPATVGGPQASGDTATPTHASPASDADAAVHQPPALSSQSSRSTSGLDTAAAGHAVASAAEPAAPEVTAVNSMMSADHTVSSVSSHALGLTGTSSDGQQPLQAPAAAVQATRSHFSEAGSAGSGSIKRTASSASGTNTVAAAGAAPAAANATVSVMSGVSGGSSAPSAGISSQVDGAARSRALSGTSEPSHSSTVAATDSAGSGQKGAPVSGSGALANSGSAGLVQSTSAMSGGANSGQLSVPGSQPDTHRSGGADSDEEEEDPGSHPDHFLSRIARRVESGSGEQPQPLQSSNTVNTSPGRHNTIGHAMPEDLREKVTETFNKIGMPNTSMMGLETLYSLLEENPSFPVEDLLSRTSEPFRQYISKGLHKVHKKRVKMRRGLGRPHQPLPTVPEVNSRSTSGHNGHTSPESLSDRQQSVA